MNKDPFFESLTIKELLRFDMDISSC